MKNVTINGKKYERDGEMPVKLNNGSLVVHYNKMGDVHLSLHISCQNQECTHIVWQLYFQIANQK